MKIRVDGFLTKKNVNLREVIKEAGFTWNRRSASWEKATTPRQAVEIIKNLRSYDIPPRAFEVVSDDGKPGRECQDGTPEKETGRWLYFFKKALYDTRAKEEVERIEEYLLKNTFEG
jgi:hypothetical protein